MAIDFQNSPTVGSTKYVNGVTWVYNGTGWVVNPSTISQQNSDWNSVVDPTQILNKPTIGSAASQSASSFATSTQGGKADAAFPFANFTGATNIAVVVSLPGTPDPNTLYFVTT
jgi:hypothetical protein